MSDLTMSVGELLAAVPGLQKIGDVRIPSIGAAYAFTKAKRKANVELEMVEAQRVSLCETHCQKDDAGQPVKVDNAYQFVGDGLAAFQADYAKLLAEPVTLSGVRAVSLSELAGVETSPDVLFALGPFVVESAE